MNVPFGRALLPPEQIPEASNETRPVKPGEKEKKKS